MSKRMMFLMGVLVGIQIMWVVWNIEFHFVKESGVLTHWGQQYHVIPFDGSIP